MEFTRKIEFTPAFDKRHSDPSKNYGVHGVNMKFVLVGPEAAVQFLLYTNWHLPHVQEEMDSKHLSNIFPHLLCHPQPADLGYHCLYPQYEGQNPISQNCEYLDGKPCYYDGSTLNAERVYETLVSEGEEPVWEILKERYLGLSGIKLLEAV